MTAKFGEPVSGESGISALFELGYNGFMKRLGSFFVIGLLFGGLAYLAVRAIQEPEQVSPHTQEIPIATEETTKGATPQYTIPRDLFQLGDTGSHPRLSELSDSEIEALAQKWAVLPMPVRVLAFGFLQLETPYQIGALGEETPPDTDPLVRYDVTDCAILNLISVSLAHATEEGSVRDAMKVAGYRPGEPPSYASRLHFTADRNDVSPYFEPITDWPGMESAEVTLNQKADGTQWIPIDWTREKTIHYLPTPVALSKNDYPPIVGVAFLKTKMFSDGLDVLHEGILYGGDTVLHASLRQNKVILEPFSEMASRYDGMVFFHYR